MLIEKAIETLIVFAKDRVSAQRTPRKRAARLFVGLYDSLTKCHSAFGVFKSLAETNGPPKGEAVASAESNWLASVDDLVLSLKRVKTELRLFAPDSYRNAETYAVHELTHVFNRRQDEK